MNAQGTKWRENSRIIWAITAKDLVEALKNKNTIALVITSLLMLVLYRGLPILESRADPPHLRIYDPGNSALVAFLENSDRVDVSTYPSEEQMKENLANSDVPELGLVIPADFDQEIESGGEPQLQGYFMNWVNLQKAVEIQQAIEAEISGLVGRPVQIQIQGNLVFPTPDSGGLGVTAGLGLIFVITMIGLVLIPHLMVEEVNTHTLEALLVSPASEGQVVIAKALTGLTYCLVGAAVGAVIFYNLVVHWWLMVLALVCGSLFSISLGLLLGTLIENREQLTLWASAFVIPLFFPVILTLLEDMIPAGLVRVFRLLPSVAVFNQLRTAFSGPIPVIPSILQLAYTLIWAAGVLLLVAWRLRRRDRQMEPMLSFGRSTSRSAAPVAKRNLFSLAPLLDNLTRQPKSQTAPETPPQVDIRVKTKEEFEVDRSKDGRRIIWAIAIKDIVQAIKSKLVLSIMIGTGLLVLNGTLMPLLLGLRDKPTAIVYDQGSSTILRALTGREDFRLLLVDSQGDMEEAVSNSTETRLGLVIPTDFDQQAGGGGDLQLQGYFAHWANPEKMNQQIAFFEEQLSLASWGTVKIETTGTPLYPQVGSGGQVSMTSLLMIIVIMVIGMTLVPLLFLQEKEAHTLEALLISPANIAQVVIGKALAGGFYCLLAAVVVVLLNHYLFVHWEVVILAILLSSFFAVAVGLLVGYLSDNQATTGLWECILIIVFMGLAILEAFDFDMSQWPAILQSLLKWQPGTTIIQLFRISMAGNIPFDLLWTNAIALLVAAAGVYGAIFALVRTADR